MPSLEIRAFKGLEVIKDGQAIRSFRSIKERALLAYLTTEQGSLHARVSLAGLLWPDDEESRARRNLSQTLLNLRKALEEDKEKPFLDVSSKQIGIHKPDIHKSGTQKHGDITIDVVAFQNHLQDVEDHEHENLFSCTVCTSSLQQATALYTGDFLEGFYIAESDLFEEWMIEIRGRLERNAVDALITLSQCFETQNNYSKAQQALRRVLAITPWQESAHRNLMRLLAQTGKRSQALNQFELCSKLLMDELGVEPTKETLELHQQIIDGTIEIAKQPVATSAEQNQQPETRPIPFQAAAPPEHFSGRRTEIAELKDMLLERNNATVGIVAMGGAGKSTLALEVARSLKNDFKDGVLWASIASSTPLDILDGWAQAYGYDYSGLADIESKEAALRGVLAEKEILFILDDVGKSSKARDLKVGGNKSAVLLTTRDQDVAIALNAKILSLPELLPEASLEILKTILSQERIEKEVDSAKQICELLQHLPLAVEIAAKRLKSRQRMKLEAMVARLSDTQNRLDLEISDLAVRSSFEVSWEALDFELRTFFPLLAIFEGRPFTAEALAYISGTDVYTAEDYLYTLQALSMVGEDGSAHYKQHPLLADFAKEKQEDENFKQHLTLAEFAKEKLTDPQDAYAKMADYYYRFAKENSKNYDALNPEWGNMIAAIGIAHEQENWQLVIDFTDELAETWMKRGRFSEARNAYKLAKDASEHIDDSKLIAENLMRWGEVCLEQNDYAEASDLLTSAQNINRENKDALAIARCNHFLAKVAFEHKNLFQEALDLLKQNISIYETFNNDEKKALTIFLIARVNYNQFNFEKAVQYAKQALAFQDRESNKIERIRTLRLIAQAFISNNVAEQALDIGREISELYKFIDNEGESGATLYSLAIIYRTNKEYDNAFNYASQALSIFIRLGMKRFEGLTLLQLCRIFKSSGNYDEAIEFGLKGLEVFEILEDLLNQAFLNLQLGDVYHLLKRTSERDTAWGEVEKLANSLNHDWLRDQLSERPLVEVS